jgi:expansin
MKRPTLLTIWKVALWLVLLVVVIGMSSISPVSGQNSNSLHVWLPLVMMSGSTTTTSSNPIHTGIASFYPATGQGNCSYVPPAPEDLMVTAMNRFQFDASAICGAYLQVIGPKGSVTVRVVDFCPGCIENQIDLSEEAFDRIGDRSRGYADITWQVVSPALSGPIGYHFLEGTNQWWPALNIRNTRNPIASLEYLNSGGQWVRIPRSELNWFVEDHPKMGAGPYTFRVTDMYGNVLVDSNIKLVANSIQPGAKQFPPGP